MTTEAGAVTPNGGAGAAGSAMGMGMGQAMAQQMAQQMMRIGTFKTENHTYQFVINGRSGEVYGDYPIDKLKVALVTICCIILAALVYYMIFS